MQRTILAALAFSIPFLAAPVSAQEGLPLPPGVPGEVMRAEAGPPPSNGGVRTHRFVGLPSKVREHLERNGSRYRRGATSTAQLVASPVFAGAILANELAHGVKDGDPDKVGDVAHMVNTPEFYNSIAMFNLALRAGDGSWSTAAKAAQRAGLGSVAPSGTIGRISSKAVGALRHNLVLAVAMTLPRAVQVDFGGATFSQMIKGDFSNLDINVGKGDWTSWDELAITLGAFAVAGPPVRALARGFAIKRFAFPGFRKLFSLAGRMILRRTAKTAAVKGGLAVAPIPGSRVAAGALTVGETLFAIGELGAILFTAGELEAPVHRWNDQRKMKDEINGAVEHLLTVARDVEDIDGKRADEIREDIGDLRKKLDEAYEKMANHLVGAANSPIRRGSDGKVIDAAFLKSVDPTELRTLHYVDLEFDFAKERYEDVTKRYLDEAAEMKRKGSDRRALESLFEQMFLELGQFTVNEQLRRMSDDLDSEVVVDAEFLAGLSTSAMRRTLAYENVRFPLTHLNFLSVPHRLAAENFQRVVLDRADEIIELHQKIHEQQQQLDPEAALDEAIVRVAQLFADKRDYHYLDQAIADETLLQRLQRWGETRENLGGLVDSVLQEVGPWEALPGQTLAMRARYEDHPGLPGHGKEAMDTTTRHWLEEAQSKVRGIYDAKLESKSAITPTARERKKKSGWGRLKFWKKDEDESYHLADSWTISDNRRQLFEQEQLVYAEAMSLVSGSRLKERLATEIAIVEALRSLDDEIVAGILAPIKEDEEEEDEEPVEARRDRTPRTSDSPGMIGSMEGSTDRAGSGH